MLKKFFLLIWEVIRGFLINPFWKTLAILIPLGLTLAINGILWYIYVSRIQANPTPFAFASSIIVLNLVLSNYLYHKEPLASYLLLYTSLFIEILMLVFVRYLLVTI